MKNLLLACAFVILFVSSARAQVSAGVYGGATSDSHSTWMVMADIGSTVDLEPWVQSFGSLIQTGADIVIMPKRIGVIAGVNSHDFGGHVGVALTVRGVQVRVMKHTSGAWQGVAYYNINLTPRYYIQLWAAPATDVSAYVVGLGYVFKK